MLFSAGAMNRRWPPARWISMTVCLAAVIAGARPCSAWAADDDAVRSDRERPDSDPDDEFADGWRKTVVPVDQNAEGRASRCIAWVDEGWLIVERRDVSGDVEWQIVLAQVAEGDEPPRIELNPQVPDGLRLSYRDGLFFIRDDLGNLRCLRQKKSADMKWPVLAIPKSDPMHGGGTMGAEDRMYYLRIHHGWQFIVGGLRDERVEYVLRMKHPDVEEFLGVNTQSNSGDVERFWVIGPSDSAGRLPAWAAVLDDRELLVVQRAREIDVEQGRALHEKLENDRKQLLGAGSPEIAAIEWLNSPRPVALADLKGKAAIVYYAADQGKRAADDLSAIEVLYEKYRNQGLAAVGVVAAKDAKAFAAVIKERGLKIPLAVDDGQTAERFFITGGPSCFLIGRDGKVADAQYYGRRTPFPTPLPGAVEIEKLLKADER